MKSLIICIITISCFGLYSFGHFTFLGYINPQEMAWKQFSPNGTLVYSNSGNKLCIISFLKSLIISIPTSIILSAKLRFIPNKKKIALKTSVLVNIFILLTALTFGFTGIPFGNLYYSKFDKASYLLRDFHAEILSDFVHYFSLFGIVLAITIIAFIPKNTFKKFIPF